MLNGIHAIQHYLKSTWWAWNGGSSLLFWRWPTEESQRSARDGWPVWWEDDSVAFPNHKNAQRSLTNELACQLATKIGDVQMKNYISPVGLTLSDVDYFPVPKIVIDGVIIDIRVVYDATRSLLNAKVWSPNFFMPTIATPLRALLYGYWVVDFDLGEFFLNFPLPEALRKYVGVRMEAIKEILGTMDNTPLVFSHESWVRYLMGFTASPFSTIKSFYHAEEAVVGDHTRKDSPVRWDRVILNCIGDPKFDPRLPFVIQWDDVRECIAGAVSVFVDDGHGSGKDEEHCWQVARLYTTVLQYLGIQNAARKTRPPTNKNPGAWAYSNMIYHHLGFVHVIPYRIPCVKM